MRIRNPRLLLPLALVLVMGGTCFVLCGCGRSNAPPAKKSEQDHVGEQPIPAGDKGVGRAKPAPPARVETYREIMKLARQPDPKHLPRLKQAARDTNWKKRHAGITGIGQLKDKGDPKFLMSVLGNTAERPEVRAAAAEALGAMRYYEAGPLLIQAMESDSVRLRAAAGVAIRNIMRIRYGYSATGSLAERNNALALLRANWPRFYEYMRRKEQR